MPKPSFAAAAKGLPRITRRAALSGMAATALTTVPALAADQPSPVAELIEDYRFACEEQKLARDRAEKIAGKMKATVPSVRVGNFRIDGKRVPIYECTHADIDKRADVLDNPEIPQFHAVAERLRALWHTALSEAEELYNSEAARYGLIEAEDAADRAWDAKFEARDAVLTYPCQTVADYQARDSFIRDLLVNDEITDDLWELVFADTAN